MTPEVPHVGHCPCQGPSRCRLGLCNIQHIRSVWLKLSPAVHGWWLLVHKPPRSIPVDPSYYWEPTLVTATSRAFAVPTLGPGYARLLGREDCVLGFLHGPSRSCMK
jgi:hypothetical protein